MKLQQARTTEALAFRDDKSLDRKRSKPPVTRGVSRETETVLRVTGFGTFHVFQTIDSGNARRLNIRNLAKGTE